MMNTPTTLAPATCPACGARADVYRRVRIWPREMAALVCLPCAEATEQMATGGEV